MLSLTLTVCAILEVTVSHSLYNNHLVESRPQENVGFPFVRETNSYGSQTGPHRRHIQGTKYVNLHKATNRQGIQVHFGSGASRVEDPYNYKLDKPAIFFQSYSVLNNERDSNFITTNIFKFFSTHNKIKAPKIKETRVRNVDHDVHQEKVFEIKKDTLNNIGIASRGLNVNSEDQTHEAKKPPKSDFSTEPVETKPEYDQTHVVHTRSIKTETTPTPEKKHQEDRVTSNDKRMSDDSKVAETPTSTTTKVHFENRDAFDGGDCPTGMVRVSGVCAKEHKPTSETPPLGVPLASTGRHNYTLSF